MKSKIDNNLRNAKNIGATIEKYLNEIGIFTLILQKQPLSKLL